MLLKRHVVRKDQKEHIYYSLCESVRVSGKRTVQRRLLNLGELNTTQIERWQRSIEVVQQEGGSRQYRLFTDRKAPTSECARLLRGHFVLPFGAPSSRGSSHWPL